MKKGISAVVATVLLILITIIAVTIVWVVVMPIIQKNVGIEEKTDLSIVTLEGYTVWDAERQAMSVQVKRGIDNTNLSGIQFIFSREGSSITEIVYDVPGINQIKIYKFYLGALEGEPDSIKIAPIFASGSVGGISANVEKVDVPKGKVIGSLRVVRGGGSNGLETISLTDCGTLDTEGGFYLLENDVNTTGNCFIIGANEITLDLNGHSLTGDDLGLDYGVYMDGYNKTTIKDGQVSNFFHGIYLTNTTDNLIEEMILSSNYDGIYLYPGSSDNIIKNNNISLNKQSGISILWESSGNLIEDNIVSFNMPDGFGFSYGIYIYAYSDNNIIKENIINSNYRGVFISASSNNTLINNNVNSSQEYGIWFSAGSNHILNNNTACNNGLKDFSCVGGSAGNSGTGNIFGDDKLTSCSDNAWPETGCGLYYAPCDGGGCPT